MKAVFQSLTLAIFIFLLTTSAAQAQANAPTAGVAALSVLNGGKISGAWRINHAESDNPILKMQAFLQNKLAQSANEKTANARQETLPTMSVSLVAPETLILSSDDAQSMTINEAFSEVVFTRTLTTDGKQRIGELQGGANFLMAATQNDNRLRVEIISPRGNKMTENYTIADEGKKLIVNVRFEDAQAREILTLRRVYDRAPLDLSTDDAKQIQ